MTYHGYAGSILYVDLTSGNIRKESIDEELIRNYIGNLGINTKLTYDLIEPGTDPLSPENQIILGTGPLAGTTAPACCRSNANFKSPLTNFFGSTNSGESVALMMKFAGYDYLVVGGRADRPVYLKIDDDDVAIMDAGHLWGKDIFETTDILWKDLGDYWVNCIGPAGENMVKYAVSVTNKHSVYGRTGIGALMGSKNLKAIVSRGSKGITLASPDDFFKMVGTFLEKIKTGPATALWRDLGFVVAFPAYSQFGLFERYNYAEGFADLADIFSKEEYKRRIVKRAYACPGCPVGCKQVVEMKEGAFAGLNYKVAALGSQVGYHNNAGVDNWDDLVKCVELENRYGLDSNSLGSTVGFAIELYKNGIITKEDTDGLELDWGGRTSLALIDKIVRREGIGDILAEGVKAAAQKFGSEAEKYAGHIKGLEVALGLRGRLSTENFGELTNPRGAHLERSPSLTFIPRKPKAFPPYSAGIGIPEDRIESVCDGPEGFNVSRLTKWVEDYNTVLASMGMCHRTPVTQHFNLQTIADLFTAATGIDMSPGELRQAGERIWNLQRAFNQREGADKKDDMPPWRVKNQSIIIGDKEYPPITEDRAQKLLEEYYDERGWNPQNGKLTREKLEALGLSAVASDLGL
ncbi:aldehyde ferredoxin oxidoreductase family protein [Thermodesulfobacteriota bacterium]